MQMIISVKKEKFVFFFRFLIKKLIPRQKRRGKMKKQFRKVSGSFTLRSFPVPEIPARPV